jgi:hypothetical protein
VADENEEREEGSIAHPPEGEQEDSIESEETLSPDELGEES